MIMGIKATHIHSFPLWKWGSQRVSSWKFFRKCRANGGQNIGFLNKLLINKFRLKNDIYLTNKKVCYLKYKEDEDNAIYMSFYIGKSWYLLINKASFQNASFSNNHHDGSLGT